MALQSCILVPAGADGVTTTLATVTATAAITVGLGALFTLNTDTTLTITFGNTGGKAATTPSATVGLMIPAGASLTFDLGASYDSFKLFNTDTGTANYSYMQLSRF